MTRLIRVVYTATEQLHFAWGIGEVVKMRFSDKSVRSLLIGCCVGMFSAICYLEIIIACAKNGSACSYFLWGEERHVMTLTYASHHRRLMTV